MAILINSEREQMDLNILPEYVRELKGSAKEPAEVAQARHQKVNSQPEHQKPDMLEALWPGVHHDFTNPATRRSPSFYLMLGFVFGLVVSLSVVWTFSSAFPWLAGLNKTTNNGTAQKDAVDKQATRQMTDEAIAPLSLTYEVQAGDTLAAIALRNYKRISPRLLDEICRANNMKSADVLTLGQKLVLPEYHPQAGQSSITIQSLN